MEFKLFGKLPVELRLKIWKEALPEERIAEIKFNKMHESNKQAKFYSRTPTPALLHACRESRNFSLKFYSKLVVAKRFLGTYVRWELDIIFLGRASIKELAFGAHNHMMAIECEFNRQCQRLGVIEDYTCYLAEWLEVYPHLSNLKEIVAVIKNHEPGYDAMQVERLTELVHPLRIHCCLAGFLKVNDTIKSSVKRGEFR